MPIEPSESPRGDAPGADLDSALSSPRILQSVATKLLPLVPDLVEHFTEQVVRIPGYGAGAVELADLRVSAEQSLTLLVQRISGSTEDTSLVSRAIGRARADAGIPLESLMHAVRLDFRLVWGALVDQIRPSEMPALLIGGTSVWEAVEDHANNVLIGYQQRVLESSRALEEERRNWFARLLAVDGTRPDVVNRTAGLLGFVPTRRFLVMVAARPHGALSSADKTLRARGIATYLHNEADLDTLVVQLPSEVIDDWRALIEDAPLVVVAPVTGLSAVPARVRLARAAHAAAPPTSGPRTTEDSWVALAAVNLGEFGAHLRSDVLGALDEIDERERERLLEAAATFLETNSVGETAARLFCHRNTVFNRLSRFRELTGRDVTDVRQAALVQLALGVDPS